MAPRRPAARCASSDGVGMPQGDAWARAQRTTEGMERHLAAIARLADERAVAIQELLDHGFTRSEVARRLGVTPAVITKVLRRPVVAGAHTAGN